MNDDWITMFLWIAILLLLLSNLSLLGRNERARRREAELRGENRHLRTELVRLGEELRETELVVNAVLDKGDGYNEFLSLPELVQLALSRTEPVYRERKP